MKTGRRAKPTALKLVQGNPGRRPINEAEPKPPKVFRPRAPNGFTRLERAKWGDMCKKLAGCRVLTELDLDALEIYVRNWVAMHDALRDVTARGKLLQTPGGGVMWNPSWTQYKHSEQVCRSLQSEFGMTPSSRTSVQAVGREDGKNRWSDF